MNSEQATAFLKALRAKNLNTSSSWVRASCPLARWTHESATDSSPSFAVRVEPTGESHFNCFACTHGSLSLLLQLIDSYAAADGDSGAVYGTPAAREILAQEEQSTLLLPEWTPFQQTSAPFEEWPQWYLDTHPRAYALSPSREYLNEGRMADGNQPVSEAVAADFDLRVDWSKRMILAPFRTVGGRLAGMRGRSFDPTCEKQFTHFDYDWNKVNNTRLVWYNERALADTRPIIVVEGQFDVFNVAQVYPGVVGILSTKITVQKMQKLLQAEFVLFMLDNDGPGAQHQPEYMQWLKRQGRLVGEITYEGKDPAKLDPQWLRDDLKGVVPLD